MSFKLFWVGNERLVIADTDVGMEGHFIEPPDETPMTGLRETLGKVGGTYSAHV